MTTFEDMPTFLGYSEGDVGVIAGGGLFGYGGVMLHEPTQADFHKIAMDIDIESDEPKGVGFNYNSVSTITVSGLLRWTNSNLERAPQGRQDLREVGPVRIEIFDQEESREYIKLKAALFEKLGIHFIG